MTCSKEEINAATNSRAGRENVERNVAAGDVVVSVVVLFRDYGRPSVGRILENVQVHKIMKMLFFHSRMEYT